MTNEIIVPKSTYKRGGPRSGSGRPSNSGRYGEETVPVRIPKSLVPKINELLNEFKSKIVRPEATIPMRIPKSLVPQILKALEQGRL